MWQCRVTRWLDYLLNIYTHTNAKSSKSIIFQYFAKYYINPLEMPKNFKFLPKVAKISPNLVTLRSSLDVVSRESNQSEKRVQFAFLRSSLKDWISDPSAVDVVVVVVGWRLTRVGKNRVQSDHQLAQNRDGFNRCNATCTTCNLQELVFEVKESLR